MTDADQYDPDSTVMLVRASLDDWLAALSAAQQQVSALANQALPAEQADSASQAKTSLTTLTDQSKKIDWLMHVMASYITRLEQQRQSSKTAFTTGYEARYKDILAQLSSSEYAELRAALKRTDGEEIPF